MDKKGKKEVIDKKEQPVYVIAQPQDSGDEIDLLEIFSVIWKRKTFLIIWCFVITVAALIIALLMPKIYEAETTFYPPNESDLSTLNITDFSTDKPVDIYSVKPLEVYNVLVKNLNSKEIRKNIFSNCYLTSLQPLPDTDSKPTFINFNNAIAMTLSKIDRKSLSSATATALSFKDHNKDIVAPVVNNLVDAAVQKTEEEVLEKRKKIITSKIASLKQHISQLRQKAKDEREDEIIRLETDNNVKIQELQKKIDILKEQEKIAIKDQLTQLSEAMNIAESMGIDDPLEHALETISKVNSSSSATIQADLTPQTSNLYALGTIALEARIKALKERKNLFAFVPQIRSYEREIEQLRNNPKIAELKNRKNDDPYIKSLRSLEGNISMLTQSIQESPSFFVLSAHTPADTPEKPVKSKKLYVLIAGMMLALISGLGIVLLQHFLKKQEAVR